MIDFIESSFGIKNLKRRVSLYPIKRVIEKSEVNNSDDREITPLLFLYR